MYDFFLRWRNKTPSASEEAEGGEGPVESTGKCSAFFPWASLAMKSMFVERSTIVSMAWL